MKRRSRRPLLVAPALVLALIPAMAGASAPSAATRAPAPAAPGVCAAPALAGSISLTARVPMAAGYDREQVARALTILDVGDRAKVPARAQALALTAALAESGLKRGRGRALAGVFHGSGASPALERVGVADFYDRLLAVPGWSTLPAEVALHRVTRNADPFRYDPFWASALELLDRLARGRLDVPATVQSGARSPQWCRPRGTSDVGAPFPPGTGYQVAPRGTVAPARRAAAPVEVRSHCGAAVLAASSGSVKVGEATRTGWELQVVNDAAKVVTRYQGLVGLTVSDGQSIGAGEQLGSLGSLGATDGCALGFRVLGGTGQDLTPIDASAWLQRNMTRPATRPAPEQQTSAPARPTTLRLASYNVLGAHHSAPGGKNAAMADGAWRMRESLARLESHGVDIAVFNEFEGPQAAVVLGDSDWELLRATGNSRLRGGDFSGNAIAWRSAEWRLVGSEEVTVPWDVTLHLPVAHLVHVDTGAAVVVMGVHNPASTQRKGNQQGARDRARAIERAAVSRLASETGDPVFLIGDMNERATVFCDFTGDGLMTTPYGAASGGGCSTPRGFHGGVDWIFGAGPLAFGGGLVDRSTKDRLSDHPLVMADVTVGG